MIDNKIWEVQFDNHNNSCFVIDAKTDELLYVNQKLLDTFELNIDIIGKTFINAINNNIKFTVPTDWKSKQLVEFDVYNDTNNQRYNCTSIHINNDENIFFELAPSIPSSKITFDDAMTTCIDILNQPKENVVFSLMELLSNFYECENACLYRFNFEDNTLNCVSKWSIIEQNRIEFEVRTKIANETFISFLENNKTNIISGNKTELTSNSSTFFTEIFEVFNVDNFILCRVVDVNGKSIGAVGLSNFKNHSSFCDNRLITTISKFVSLDVTKVIAEDEIFQLNHRDSLTGLYDRVGYAKRVDQIMKENPSSIGVVSININGLKYINENLGTEGGDNHIKSSVQRIQNHFDFEFFRMSGDEFVGIACNVEEEPFDIEVISLYTALENEKNHNFSLGHSWGSGKNCDISKLVQEADMLTYINKQKYYFESDRDFDSVTDTTLADLLLQLENDEFLVYLQPQFILEDDSLYGAEALIRRYDKKNKKMVFPDQFIPLYEQKSVIRHLDIFVLETVCKLLQEWLSIGKSIPVSVNFSRVTLQEYGIVNSIAAICDKYQVPHKLVVIEVTERVGLIENNVASSLVKQFKEQGFHISLDDFGCAYSNIVTLAQIEVDEVKIDKSLVDFIMESRKNRVLVKNVLSMCNELDGASTLAEGIEDSGQADILRELGCQLGQGYLYSRPIPNEEFVEKYIKQLTSLS